MLFLSKPIGFAEKGTREHRKPYPISLMVQKKMRTEDLLQIILVYLKRYGVKKMSYIHQIS